MDSLTHAALGAALGEATLGGRHRMGRTAMLWGAALGSLPDLDVLAYPWLDTLGQLTWHRGLTHSIFFSLVLAALLGSLLVWASRGRVGWLRAALAVFLILSTHILLDVFTIYGTMVWAPFSTMRVGTGLLFIIDPIFTLALLAGLAGAIFLRPEDPRRQRRVAASLLVACGYLLWCGAAKGVANHRFLAALAEQGISAQRFLSTPGPFQTFTWRGLAESEDAFWVGYFSLLQPGKTPQFFPLPKNHELLDPLAGNRTVETLRWFSNGFLGVEKTEHGLLLSDWRFGEVPRVSAEQARSGEHRGIFSWEYQPSTSPRSEGALQRRRLTRQDVLQRLFPERKTVISEM